MIETTLNSGAVYSPTSDSAKKIGKNAAAVVSEATKSGTRSSPAEARAASTALAPRSIRTMIDSDITMALSTKSPSEIISEASDIWSRPIPITLITSRAITMAQGIRLATTSPVRSPSVSSITAITISTAWSRLVVNSSTFWVTTSG